MIKKDELEKVSESFHNTTSWHDMHPRLKRELNMWVVEGVFATICVILIGGKYLTEFALLIGANSFHIGLIGALPFLMQPATILAAYLCNMRGERKTIVLIGVALARAFWVFIIPLLFLQSFLGSRAIIIFLCFYTVISLGAALAGSAWIVWMANLVPEKVRGRYFGMKSALLSVLTIVVDLLASKTKDFFTSIERTELCYVILFSIASIAGVINLKYIKSRVEIPWKPEPSPKLLNALKDYYNNKTMLSLSLSIIIWNFGVGISSPFFSVQMLKFLNMTFVQIWIYTMLALLMGLAFNFIWGAVLDRTGNRSVIIFNSLFIVGIPLIWLFATPEYVYPVYFDGVMTGICWTGFNLAMFNMPMILAPKKDQSFYIGIFLALNGLAFGLGSLTGGVIADIFTDFSLSVYGYKYNNYILIFVISAMIRFIGFLMFIKIKDTRCKGTFHMLQIMGLGIQKRYFTVKDIIFSPAKETPQSGK